MALAVLQEMHLSGLLGDRLHANIAQWLLPAPHANPGIFDVYMRRDSGPDPLLSATDGAYSGKYLVSAVLLFRMQREPQLRATIEHSLFRLYDAQDEDGYLGVYPKGSRIAGNTPHGAPHADLWNHYHNMLALYLWHKTTNSLQAMERLTRAANYICDAFAHGQHSLGQLGQPQLDLAIMHIFALLYRATDDDMYLDIWARMGQAFAAIQGESDFLSMLETRCFSSLPVHDASLLYAIDSLYTLYYVTHDEKYLRPLAAQYNKLRCTSRLPNGGYGNMGKSAHTPYDCAVPEACSTAAWVSLCTDTLRATHKMCIADDLELTAFGAALGTLHPSGRYVFRDVPMSGVKHPACTAPDAHTLCGAPEMNCCSADGPHALGLIGQWGVFANDEDVYLNYYGASSAVLQLTSGRLVHITQTTSYPRQGNIAITVTTQRAVRLHLRIPKWSRNNTLSVDGTAHHDVECGQYYTLNVPTGSVHIELGLDLALHYWAGDGPRAGRHALYRGPLLMTLDRRHNPHWQTDLPPALDFSNMHYELLAPSGEFAPIALCKFTAKDGSPVYLSDYGSSGHLGTHIESWLIIRRAPSGSVWL